MTKYYKVHQKKHKEVYGDIKEKWEEWRKEYIKKHRHELYCHVCGEKHKLELHHICPRHICPDKIFNEDNIIILCKHDHLIFGHLGDYEWWNPNIKEDAVYLYGLHRMRLIQAERSER